MIDVCRKKTESGNKVRIWASGGLYTPIKKEKKTDAKNYATCF
jgi:hypothetical protein